MPLSAARRWTGEVLPFQRRVLPRRPRSPLLGGSQLVLVMDQVPPGAGWISVSVLPEQV
jgi:hypothetical protein